MDKISRRAALLGAGAVATLSAGSGLVRAAMGPNDKFDLLIKGGDVLDPSQGLRGDARHRHPIRRDRGGRRATSPRRARKDAQRDRASSWCPGLIDLHAHVFPYGSAIGIPADELVAVPGDDHARSRRAMPAPTTSRPSAASSSATTRTRLYRVRAHRQHRPHRLSGRPSSTTSTSRSVDDAARAIAENADIVHRHQGAHERERDRQARPGAAEARDPRLRECRA